MEAEIQSKHISPISGTPVPIGRGRPKNSTNLHSKHPSSIARRLKLAGIDWVVDLAQALKANNITRINIWMRLLPYLVVTQGHRRVKQLKGKASKRAIAALDELEGR
jgi:hypothetical protein